MEQDIETPRHVQLPPLRTFVVRRRNPVLEECVALEEITVQAHGWRLTDGAIVFVVYFLDATGEPYQQDRRAFFEAVDVEEVVSATPDTKSSIIVH